MHADRGPAPRPQGGRSAPAPVRDADRDELRDGERNGDRAKARQLRERVSEIGARARRDSAERAGEKICHRDLAQQPRIVGA